MDNDRLVLSVGWDSSGGALGVCGARLGRILGLGPRRKRFAAAMVDGYGFPALRDDAGKARHDEGLERLAGVHHFHAVHPRYDADTQRSREFRTRLRTIEHRNLVCGLSGGDLSGVLRGVYLQSRLLEER